MMSKAIQSSFRKFHDRIKLGRYEESATLREKRDRVLTRLRSRLVRSFDPLNQGSYAMGTGIVPLDGDYDIDVGIIIDIDLYAERDRADRVKGEVFNAVDDHTDSVSWKEPCITVDYAKSYHVDLAIYGRTTNGLLYLARGKQHAASKTWERADPKGLITTIANRWSGEDAEQFRRCIRYLKRWKDMNFPDQGNTRPTGIALTAMCLQHFQPVTLGEYDQNYRQQTYRDDRSALQTTLVRFISSNAYGRPSTRLNVAPNNDLFAKMSDNQAAVFMSKAKALRDALSSAKEPSHLDLLQRYFGDTFGY
jgi:hypothetical protein